MCEDEIAEGKVCVHLCWDDVRVKLEKRNWDLQNLSSYEVSSCPPEGHKRL